MASATGGCLCGRVPMRSRASPCAVAFATVAIVSATTGSAFEPFLSFASASVTMTGELKTFEHFADLVGLFIAAFVRTVARGSLTPTLHTTSSSCWPEHWTIQRHSGRQSEYAAKRLCRGCMVTGSESGLPACRFEDWPSVTSIPGHSVHAIERPSSLTFSAESCVAIVFCAFAIATT